MLYYIEYFSEFNLKHYIPRVPQAYEYGLFQVLNNIHNQVWLGLKWRSNTTQKYKHELWILPGIELPDLRTGLVQQLFMQG